MSVVEFIVQIFNLIGVFQTLSFGEPLADVPVLVCVKVRDGTAHELRTAQTNHVLASEHGGDVGQPLRHLAHLLALLILLLPALGEPQRRSLLLGLKECHDGSQQSNKIKSRTRPEFTS